jgi:RIO kinase 1
MKEKRSEEYRAFEEVFDKSTLMTIYDLMNKGEIDQIFGSIKAGKESKIYWGKRSDGTELAIKIYLTVSSEFKKGMITYIVGDPRFKHVRRDTRSLIYLWAKKEYRNLTGAYNSKIRVPKPFFVQNNVLLMEFIGEEGNSAPILKDSVLEDPLKIYKKILMYVKKLYQNVKIVHGDLSEYNIMIWKKKPVIFDLSQAVHLKHPQAERFLTRDIKNLNHYFKKIGAKTYSTEETLRRIRNDPTNG